MFTVYNPGTDTLTSLVNAIFTTSSGVTVQGGSISARYGAGGGEVSTISYYNGSISSLNIGSGLLLTSGDPTPAESNTSSSYGVDAGSGTVDDPDANLQATVDAAFESAGEVEDVTYLTFQINVTDPNAVGLSFEVVFGSDEYPEWSDSSFVDVAGVYVNGTNYALFNNSVLQPLSVIDNNLDPAHVSGSATVDGNFRDNTGGTIPIEYDGVSVKLQITAPIHQGLNTIKIAIADTGDSVYDSGIFVSGMQAVNYTGFGLSQQITVTGTSTVQASPGNETFQGDPTDTTVFFPLNGGQDVMDGNEGIDEAIFQMGLAAITGYSWNGSVLTLNSGANSTTLVDVERVLLGDGLFAGLDFNPGQVGFGVYAMLYAGFHVNPNAALLSQWIAEADALGGDLGATGDLIINTYAPGLNQSAVISYLYHNIMGSNPDADTLASLNALVTGETTLGDLFALGAQLSLNTTNIADIIGTFQLLDHSFFVA